MAIREHEREWAKRRLHQIALYLEEGAQDAQTLREAGIAEARISALYPFDLAHWTVAVADICAADAEWAAVVPAAERTLPQRIVLPVRMHGSALLEIVNSALATTCFTPALAEAWNKNPKSWTSSNPRRSAHILLLAIALLELLANHPVQVQEPSYSHWQTLLSVYQLLVNDIAHTLEGYGSHLLSAPADDGFTSPPSLSGAG